MRDNYIRTDLGGRNRPGLGLRGYPHFFKIVPKAIDGPPLPGPLYFFLFYVPGFVLISDDRLMEAISTHRKIALGLAIVTSSLVMYKRMTDAVPDTIPMFQGAGIEAIVGASAWFWMLAFLGYSKQYMNSSSALSGYLNKAAYPVYLMHMTIIVPLGFYITKWDMHMGLQYAVINLIALAGVMATYELIIRRSRVMGVLFGLRLSRVPKRRRTRQDRGIARSGPAFK